MRVLVLGGIIGPFLFALVTVAAAALRVDYSHVTNVISELGASGTPYAAFMNFAGLVPAGVMLAGFGISLAGLLPPHRLSIVAAVLVTLSGFGLAAAGVISCDPGCPQTGGSLEQRVHDGIGPAIALCLIIGSGILGIQFRRLSEWRHLSIYSLVTSVSAFLFLVALINSLETKALTGLWQRLLFTTLLLWCVVIALRALSNLRLAAAPEAQSAHRGS